MNRLSRYCEGLMEAAWLSALIVTPLMMSLSGNIANTVKIAVLRSIILVGLGAWGTKWISERMPHPARRADVTEFLRKPLVFPILALAFVYLFSTLFSISPLLSIQGSYIRFEGIYTLFSYIFLFALMATHLRRRQQVDRLVSVIAAASFVVDIYAILQHYRLDPIPWISADVVGRAISTIGNPIFVAAFLNLTFFLFLGRIILAFQAFRAGGTARWGELTRVILYSLVAVLNLVANWFTASRGPLIGLLAGLVIFALLLVVYWQLRRLQIVFLTMGVVAVLGLGLLFVPGSPLTASGSPAAGILGRLAEPMGGYTAKIRVLIWEGMTRIVFPHAAITFPDKTQDMWNPIRPLVGYGAETLYLIYPGNYRPEMYALEEQYIQYDRAHNEFWNTAAFFGIFGLLAEYGLFLSVFFFGLRWLGLIRSRFERLLYWWLALAGGVLGALVSVLLAGPAFLGLGIPFGLLAGVVGILLARVLRPVPASAPALSAWQALMLISLFSAVISYYVEILFGIAMVTTSFLFWTYLAVMLVIGRSLLSDETPMAVPAKNSRRNGSGNALTPAAPAGLWADLRKLISSAGGLVILMVMLSSGFIVNFQIGADASITLINALSSIPRPTPHTSFGVLGLFLGTLMLAALLFQLEFQARTAKRMNWSNFLASIGIALLCLLVFGMVRASQLVALQAAINRADLASISALNLVFYASLYVTLFLLCLVWAAALQPERTGGIPEAALRLPWFGANWPQYIGPGLLFLAVVYFSITLNLNPMQADMLMSQTKVENAAQRHDFAQALYGQVVGLMPQETYYLVNAEKVYRDAISASSDVQRKEQLFETGLEYLNRAAALEPLYLDTSMALARFYRAGGEMSGDAVTKNFRFFKANSYFATALNANPVRTDYWLEWAEFLALSGDLKGAYAKANKALGVDPKNELVYPFLGDLSMLEAGSQTETARSADIYKQALIAYRAQVDLITQRGGNPAQALVDVSQVYEKMNEAEKARETLLRAAGLGAGEFQWVVYQKIAEVSARLHDLAMSREYYQKAYDLAPNDQKPALQVELNKLPLP